MSTTLTVFLGPAPERGLLRRLRWWLLRRRSEAILRALPGRLRRDIGLAEGRAAVRGLRLPAAWDPGVR